MAYSYIEYTAAGSSTFNIPFDYINQSEIEVFVDGTAATFTFTSANTVNVSPTPTNGATVRVERNTDLTNRAVDFASGSVLTEEDMDNSNIQVYHAAQEAIDKAEAALSLDADGKFDGEVNGTNRVIKNVANPTNAQDVATKDYLENTWLSLSDKAQLNALNTTNLNTVAGSVANVNTVASNISDVNTVASNTTDVDTVAADITKVNTVAGSISNVNTVSGSITNVNTTAGSISNVNTVATNISDVTTVANDLNEPVSEIETVATDIANVNTVGTNISNVNAVAGNNTNITAVANNATNINAVNSNSSNINAVAGNETNINAVNSNSTNINAVAGNATNINTVAGDTTEINALASITGNIGTVAGISSDVTAVANISTDIQDVQDKLTEVQTVADDLQEAVSEIETVAASITNVDSVATNISNVNAVAGNATNINAVNANSTNINAVNANSTNINTVAGAETNINTVASNITDVNSFADTYSIGSTAPASPTAGDLWFDTSVGVNTMKVYNGTSWQNAGSSVNGTSARFKYTATSGQTTFSGSDANGNTLAYDSGYIDVFLNGIHLDPTDYTATNGTSIVLASGAGLNDELYVVAFGTFTLADHYNKTDSDARYLQPTGDGSQLTGINTDLVSDTTPQLGGNLDGQYYNITRIEKVGIGTGSPTAALDLTDGSDTNERAVRVQNSSATLYVGVEGSSANRFSGSSANNGFIGTTSNDGLELATNNNVRAVIDASGNVGIGTSSPSQKLSVAGNLDFPNQNSKIVFAAGNSSSNTIRAEDGDGYASAEIEFLGTGAAQSHAITFSTGSSPGAESITERMRIDSSGRVTMPYQPAFVITGDSTTTLGSNYDALIYKTVRQNSGSHYSTSTGRFTAPVAGYYMITAHICPTGQAQNNVIELFLMKNGGTGTRWFLDRLVKTSATSSNTFSVGGSCVIYLSANDYINISHVGGTSTATIESSSVFSGYLLG